MFKKILIVLILVLMSLKSKSENIFTDKFESKVEWELITDQVMGGVSTGKLKFKTLNSNNVAIITGNVSTKNNGGFIQIRRNLKNFNLNDAKSIKIVAKGNNEKYFIHLRTSNTILPWQYYQLSFIVTNNFKKFIFPIDKFQKSGFFLPTKINSKTIKSIGIVAFGKDYDAELIVQQISFTN